MRHQKNWRSRCKQMANVNLHQKNRVSRCRQMANVNLFSYFMKIKRKEVNLNIFFHREIQSFHLIQFKFTILFIILKLTYLFTFIFHLSYQTEIFFFLILFLSSLFFFCSIFLPTKNSVNRLLATRLRNCRMGEIKVTVHK